MYYRYLPLNTVNYMFDKDSLSLLTVGRLEHKDQSLAAHETNNESNAQQKRFLLYTCLLPLHSVTSCTH